MIELLDSEWIGNLLNISFTLVIFLLGIPIVFSQTFVPEHLRQFNTSNQNNDKILLDFSALFLLFFIFLFGNNGVRFIIDYHYPNNNIEKINQKRNLIIITYYLLSLMFFTLFCFKSYLIFKFIIFKKTDIYKDVLDNFFNNKNCLNIEQELYIEKLKELKSIYISYGNKTLFTKKIIDFLATELKAKNSFNSIFDEKIKDILKDILFPTLKSEDVLESDIIYLDKRIEEVVDKLKQNNLNASLDAISESCLPELIIKLIELGMIDPVRSLLSKLQQLYPKPETLFKLNFSFFEKKVYSELNIQIAFIIKYHNDSNKIRTDDLEPTKYNLLAYLSFYYNENNEIMKQEVKRILKIAIDNLIIEKGEFNNAINYFIVNSKLETANKIYLMEKGLNNEKFF